MRGETKHTATSTLVRVALIAAMIGLAGPALTPGRVVIVPEPPAAGAVVGHSQAPWTVVRRAPRVVYEGLGVSPPRRRFIDPPKDVMRLLAAIDRQQADEESEPDVKPIVFAPHLAFADLPFTHPGARDEPLARGFRGGGPSLGPIAFGPLGSGDVEQAELVPRDEDPPARPRVAKPTTTSVGVASEPALSPWLLAAVLVSGLGGSLWDRPRRADPAG
jgi:hypothetical protein